MTAPDAQAAQQQRTRSNWFAPTLRGYQHSWLRADILAGLTAGTVVIPQAMAYATVAGLPVQIGLYTCIVPMILYALLGGARAISTSTTSTIAVLVATTLATLPGDRSADDLLAAAFTLTFLVGICLLLFRLLHLGSVVEIISPATLTGIRTGVGLTVAATQLPALLGLPAVGEGGFFRTIAAVVSRLGAADLITAVVSAVALAFLLLMRKFAPGLPAPLLVVAGGILLVVLTPWEDSGDGRGLALIDKVPTGLPIPQLPVLTDMPALLPGAMAIAVMAFLETVMVARTNRRSDEPRIDVDQELLANGVASIGGGLSQTMPPAGGFSQSAVNLRIGAHSQLAQLTTAALAILVALFLAPLLDNLPQAILAAMVMSAILGLLGPSDYFRFARLDRSEFWVAVVVALLGLTGGMLLGVGAGVALTLALVVRHVNQPRARPLYRAANGGWTTNPPNDDGQSGQNQDQSRGSSGVPEQVLLLHLDGSLYAGNAAATADAIREAAATSGARVVILEGLAVNEVTIPLVDTLHELSDDLAADHIVLLLAAFSDTTVRRLSRSNWFHSQQQAGLVFATVDLALAYATSRPEDQSSGE